MWLKATFFCLQKHYDPLRGRPWPQPLAPWPANHLCGDSGDSYSIPVSIPCCTHFCWFNPYVRPFKPHFASKLVSVDDIPICAWWKCISCWHFFRVVSNISNPVKNPMGFRMKPSRDGKACRTFCFISSIRFLACKSLGKCFEKVLGGIMVGNQESIVMKVNKNGLTDWSWIDENEIKWIRMDESRTLGPHSWWCLLLGETNGWVVLYCWAQLQ